MNKLTLDCRAKINLSIDVTSKLPNGYHDVEMIYQEIGLSDKITLTLRNDNQIVIDSAHPTLPLSEDNLAYRAADAFFKRFGRGEGITIYIEKNIPMGAGLGGGSADAAGVLKGLNALFGSPFNQEKLMEIAASIGADVPFCILGGCAYAEGIGELLTPLPMPPAMKCVIAKPEPNVSTRWVYENLDYTQKPAGLNVRAVAAGIQKGNLFEICRNTGNILEQVTIPAYPVVGWIKDAFSDAGALISLMSGSGSAVFGLFRDEKDAALGAEAAEQFADNIYLL